MIKKIEKAFTKLNEELLRETPFNTPEFRKKFTERLYKEIGGNIIVRCDEYNNSAQIIDLNGLVAHVWCLSEGQFNPIRYQLVFSHGTASGGLISQIEKEEYAG